VQTPYTVGDGDGELAKFDASPAGRFGPAEWSRIVVRGIAHSKVKDLANYRKTYQLPDRVTPRANQFFARLAAPELQSDLDAMYGTIVESFSYRRKDVHKGLDDGSGSIRTPDFEYAVGVELDPAEPGLLRWTRDVGQLTDPGTIRTPAFAEVFGRALDRLIFEFAEPRDVAEFIDRYEERPWPGSRMTADPEATWCELKLAGLTGSVRLEANRLTVIGRPGHAGNLLDVLYKFFDTGPKGTAIAVK
jgi:hypothetical protein